MTTNELKAKVLAEIESRRQHALTRAGECFDAKDYVGERLFMFSEGELRSLLNKLSALPDEPEPMVRWCLFSGDEPVRIKKDKKLLDAEMNIERFMSVRKVEIREVQNG